MLALQFEQQQHVEWIKMEEKATTKNSRMQQQQMKQINNI